MIRNFHQSEPLSFSVLDQSSSSTQAPQGYLLEDAETREERLCSRAIAQPNMGRARGIRPGRRGTVSWDMRKVEPKIESAWPSVIHILAFCVLCAGIY